MRILNTEKFLGYQGESYSRELKFEIDDELKDCDIYFEFEKKNSKKTYISNKIDITKKYMIPYEILNEVDFIEVQMVAYRGNDFIKKSAKKNFYVQDSINAVDTIINDDGFRNIIVELTDKVNKTNQRVDVLEQNSIPNSEKGVANGVATLDNEGKVPSSQLPSYVDDVIEYPTMNDFPSTGEKGKIYLAQDTNNTYRWSGSTYVLIHSKDLEPIEFTITLPYNPETDESFWMDTIFKNTIRYKDVANAEDIAKVINSLDENHLPRKAIIHIKNINLSSKIQSPILEGVPCVIHSDNVNNIYEYGYTFNLNSIKSDDDDMSNNNNENDYYFITGYIGIGNDNKMYVEFHINTNSTVAFPITLNLSETDLQNKFVYLPNVANGTIGNWIRARRGASSSSLNYNWIDVTLQFDGSDVAHFMCKGLPFVLENAYIGYTFTLTGNAGGGNMSIQGTIVTNATSNNTSVIAYLMINQDIIPSDDGGDIEVDLGTSPEDISGTLTVEQIETLSSSKNAYIKLNNEIYRYQGEQTIDGIGRFLLYSNVWIIENIADDASNLESIFDKGRLKLLAIATDEELNNRSWVIISNIPLPTGGDKSDIIELGSIATPESGSLTTEQAQKLAKSKTAVIRLNGEIYWYQGDSYDVTIEGSTYRSMIYSNVGLIEPLAENSSNGDNIKNKARLKLIIVLMATSYETIDGGAWQLISTIPLESDIEINLTVNLTQQDLINGAVEIENVGTADEGDKIRQGRTNANSLPQNAIINISLTLEGGGSRTIKVKGIPYKDSGSIGYAINFGGYVSADKYLFVTGVIGTKEDNTSTDGPKVFAQLAFNTNIVPDTHVTQDEMNTAIQTAIGNALEGDY